MEENDLSSIPLYVVKWDVVSMGTGNYTIEKMYKSCTQPDYVIALWGLPGLHSLHETDLMGYRTSSYHLSRCLAMLHKVLGMEKYHYERGHPTIELISSHFTTLPQPKETCILGRKESDQRSGRGRFDRRSAHILRLLDCRAGWVVHVCLCVCVCVCVCVCLYCVLVWVGV